MDVKLIQIEEPRLEEYLALRNQDSSVRWALQSKKVTRKENENFWMWTLRDRRVMAYEIVDSETNNLLGVASAKVINQEAFISLSIFEKYQGIGIGTRTLNLLIGELYNRPIKRLVAHIKRSNTVSIKLFSKMGFTETTRRLLQTAEYERLVGHEQRSKK